MTIAGAFTQRPTNFDNLAVNYHLPFNLFSLSDRLLVSKSVAEFL